MRGTFKRVSPSGVIDVNGWRNGPTTMLVATAASTGGRVDLDWSSGKLVIRVLDITALIPFASVFLVLGNEAIVHPDTLTMEFVASLLPQLDIVEVPGDVPGAVVPFNAPNGERS